MNQNKASQPSSCSKWFSGLYRRNLVDMHIADWNPEFLSKFSPEDYCENLKRAHINVAMIYLQAHTGLCYFPTKTGHMHNALNGREDMIRRLTELCHENDIRTVGYYSLINNTYEEDRHPEWRVTKTPDGKSLRQEGGRYGLCCPNNPEYIAFTVAQIAEMGAYFKLDGMFYDMTFWPCICRCSHCLERYKAETGKDMPVNDDWSDPDWIELMTVRERWMGEFAALITDATRRLMPDITVEHNYSAGVAVGSSECGATELVNDACDYTGGDLYGDLYNHSFTAKYYYNVTKNQPFEYMTCRCDNSLYAHTITKDEETLSVEVMLTAANHGASFIIDAIDPRGTLDRRVYERLVRVFERQMPYEKYFVGNMAQDIGVYYATTARYNSTRQNYNNKTCSVNLVKTFIEANIPVGVVSNATVSLEGKKAVFAPAVARLPESSRKMLIEYVKNGGSLYFSGAEERELLSELIGAEYMGLTDEYAVYIAPTEKGVKYFEEFNTDYPLPNEFRLPIVKVSDAEILATMTLPYTKPFENRFASIHSNPPGIATDIPALVSRSYGKGKVIWSAAPIENEARRAYRRIMLALTADLCDLSELTLISNAPRQVELVTFTDKDTIYINAVDLLHTNEGIPVRSFDISVKCSVRPSKIKKIAGRDKPERDVDFNYKDGRVYFKSDELVMFDMYRIS